MQSRTNFEFEELTVDDREARQARNKGMSYVIVNPGNNFHHTLSQFCTMDK
jgi:hypothetical protein